MDTKFHWLSGGIMSIWYLRRLFIDLRGYQVSLASCTKWWNSDHLISQKLDTKLQWLPIQNGGIVTTWYLRSWIPNFNGFLTKWWNSAWAFSIYWILLPTNDRFLQTVKLTYIMIIILLINHITDASYTNVN